MKEENWVFIIFWLMGGDRFYKIEKSSSRESQRLNLSFLRKKRYS
jgi:hypothetical protein